MSKFKGDANPTMLVICFFSLLLAISYCTLLDGDNKSTTSSTNSKANLNARAAVACRNAVRDVAKFSSKADFNGWSRRYGITGENVTVQEEVELMNGLGMMVPHTYRCTYDRGEATIIFLRPGN